MATEIAGQMRELIEDGAEPISLAEITDRAYAGLFAYRPGAAALPAPAPASQTGTVRS